MPDEAKFAKLDEVGFKILPCCVLCTHGVFPAPTPWGHCTKHKYTHGKHTGERYLGVNRYGGCKSFEPDENKLFATVQSYSELLGEPLQ